jgi:hypothetical protein
MFNLWLKRKFLNKFPSCSQLQMTLEAPTYRKINVLQASFYYATWRLREIFWPGDNWWIVVTGVYDFVFEVDTSAD